MALKYLVDIDLSGSEIQNFAIQTSSGVPTGLATGHMVYDTDAAQVKIFDSEWKVVGLVGDETTLTVSSGTISIKDSGVTSAKIADNAIYTNHLNDNIVTAAKLDVVGNGTAGQVLGSDGDGTFSWINNPDEDVSPDNLTQRLSEIPNDIIIGAEPSSTVTITGNLKVSGTTTTVNTETINLADNIITLNSNATELENAGIEVYGGDEGIPNPYIVWDLARMGWHFSNDGEEQFVIPTPTMYTNNTGTVESIAVSGADGISVSGSPITVDGTIALSLADDGIANAKLANDSITINGTAVALGGSINVGDITGVTAGDGLVGGGDTGAVTLTNQYVVVSVEATGANDWFVISGPANQFRATTAVVSVFDEDNGGSMALTDVRRVDDENLSVWLPDGNFRINISALRG